MKIIKSIKSNKVFNIKLIKNKMYQPQINTNFNEIKLKLKKILKVVFKFFLSNKKVLFLGVNSTLNNFVLKLIKNTRHTYVPNNVLFKGILTNTNLVLKSLVLYKGLGEFTKPLFNLKLKPDLIILTHDQQYNDHELLSLKVPTISFLDFSKFYDYKTGLPNNKSNLYLLYFFINILKKRSHMLKIKKTSLKTRAQKLIFGSRNYKKEFSSTTPPKNKNQQKKIIKRFLYYF
jgi:ribosomal protein S2